MTHIGLDTIGSDVGNIPLSTESVFGYVTGTDGIRWTSAQFARFLHSGIGRINQDNDPNPRIGAIFDDEVNAGTNSNAAAWSKGKRRLGDIPIIYISAANLSGLEAKLSGAGVDVFHIHLAHWGLSRAEAEGLLGGHIKAVQFASPTTEPRMLVPGSHLTLAQANVDVSVCADDYFPPRHVLPRPFGIANAHLSVDLRTHDVRIHPLPGNVRLSPHDDGIDFHVTFDAHTGHWIAG